MSLLPKKTPLNLLVAKTSDDAEQYLIAFDLKKKDWKCVGVGQALTGHLFERIVVLPIHFYSEYEHKRFIEWSSFLSNKLMIKGYLFIPKICYEVS